MSPAYLAAVTTRSFPRGGSGTGAGGAAAPSDTPIRPVVSLEAPTEVVDALKTGYASDAWLTTEGKSKGLMLVNGLWWDGIPDRPRVYVPQVQALRKNIIRTMHDPPMRGHVGYHKTLKAVSQVYYWPKMGEDILEFVRSCDSCQRNKIRGGKPAGLLQPLQPGFAR